MKRVLVIDDEPTALALLQDILGGAGYAVTAVSSGTEALRQLEGGLFDLIITDLRMPGMSGQELIAHFRRHPALRHLPIIVLATGAEEVDLGAVEADMRIGKPFSPETLLSALTSLIG